MSEENIFDKLTWRCHICDEHRTDKYISVMKMDVSDLFDSESGTIVRNIRYCDDKPECFHKASDREFIIGKFHKSKMV